MTNFSILALCLIIYQVSSCIGYPAGGTDATANSSVVSLHVDPNARPFKIDPASHAHSSSRVRRGGAPVAAKPVPATIPGQPSAGSGIGAQVAGSAGFGLGTTLLGKLFPGK